MFVLLCIDSYFFIHKAFLTVGLKDQRKVMRGTAGHPRKCSSSTTQQQTPQKAKSDQQQFYDSPAAPLIPQGEDRQSHDRHVKLMVEECRKLHPNPEITAHLMMRTFAVRRADILSGEFPSVSDVLKCYPPFRNYGEVRLVPVIAHYAHILHSLKYVLRY